MLVKDQAKADAGDVRAAYWPEGRFPVDPEKIAHAMGLHVDRAPLARGISGMLKVRKDEASRIFVDPDDVPQRQTFTIAHELGHYYERTSRGFVHFNFIDQRGGGYDAHEFYADEFASNLLMPEDEVRRQYRAGAGMAVMANHFGVSLAAVQVRLRRLGLTR